MSVDIPQPFVLDGGIDTDLGGSVEARLAGSVETRLAGSVETRLTGLPDHYTISIDRLPKIQLGVDPVELSVRIREFPSLRVHLPADFRVGLSLLGMELLTVRLCGQAMAITEPYRPNPCEVCGGRQTDNDPLPTPNVPRLQIGPG
jgi:hypothetical protein